MCHILTHDVRGVNRAQPYKTSAVADAVIVAVRVASQVAVEKLHVVKNGCQGTDRPTSDEWRPLDCRGFPYSHEARERLLYAG